MKICFLADARAEHTRRWAKYFALKGHRVDLITLNPNILPDYEPVHLHVVQKPTGSSDVFSRIRNLPTVLTKIKRIIQEICPDVIHAHSAGGYSWLTMLAGFHPYVVTPWGTDILIDSKRSRWNCLITAMALRRADLITCDAYHIRDEMIHYGVPADKIRIVIFGVDITRFAPRTDDDAELREQYRLGESHIVISTRTLTPIHDVGTFVRAIPLIKQVFPNVSFIIVGDGSERKSLESFGESLGVVDSVRFIGYVEEDEMVRWLHVADVYVSTALADAGLAASTAEAMACELPVVVTDNADNKRWVEEGAGGFLIPMGEPEVLANRVVRLLKDREMRQEFGRFNRRVIEERNNYVTEMDRMETMYEQLSRSV